MHYASTSTRNKSGFCGRWLQSSIIPNPMAKVLWGRREPSRLIAHISSICIARCWCIPNFIIAFISRLIMHYASTCTRNRSGSCKCWLQSYRIRGRTYFEVEDSLLGCSWNYPIPITYLQRSWKIAYSSTTWTSYRKWSDNVPISILMSSQDFHHQKCAIHATKSVVIWLDMAEVTLLSLFRLSRPAGQVKSS
jgi:hypothetical protein